MGRDEADWEGLGTELLPAWGRSWRQGREPMGMLRVLSSSFLSLLPSFYFSVPLTHIFPSKILSEARKGREAGLGSTLEEEERCFTGCWRVQELERTVGAPCIWENKKPDDKGWCWPRLAPPVYRPHEKRGPPGLAQNLTHNETQETVYKWP